MCIFKAFPGDAGLEETPREPLGQRQAGRKVAPEAVMGARTWKGSDYRASISRARPLHGTRFLPATALKHRPRSRVDEAQRPDFRAHGQRLSRLLGREAVFSATALESLGW